MVPNVDDCWKLVNDSGVRRTGGGHGVCGAPPLEYQPGTPDVTDALVSELGRYVFYAPPFSATSAYGLPESTARTS